MRFCEFAQFMHRNYDEKIRVSEFVPVLVDAILDDTAIDKDFKNPFQELKKSTAEAYYSGQLTIAQKRAAVITPRLDEYKFTDFVDTYSVDALAHMSDELSEYGFDVDAKNVGRATANILAQIIRRRSKGLSDNVTSLNFDRLDSGRKLKDIAPASIERRGDKLHIAGEVITLYPFQMPAESTEQALDYIRALYEVYAQKLEKKTFTLKDVASLPKNMAANHEEQREAYCRALTVERSVRDIFDDGEDEFAQLKQDAWHGINTTYWQDFSDGYARLNAVLDKVTSTTLDGSVLSQMRGLIRNIEKKGICHILVNDGVISSWVEPNE